jgi:hypothetical protein
MLGLAAPAAVLPVVVLDLLELHAVAAVATARSTAKAVLTRVNRMRAFPLLKVDREG